MKFKILALTLLVSINQIMALTPDLPTMATIGVLATSGKDSVTSSPMVLFPVETGKYIFFAKSNSKALENLAPNKDVVAVSFLDASTDILGKAKKLSKEESLKYFNQFIHSDDHLNQLANKWVNKIKDGFQNDPTHWAAYTIDVTDVRDSDAGTVMTKDSNNVWSKVK